MRNMPSEYHRRVLENRIKHRGFADDTSAYIAIFASQEGDKMDADKAYAALKKYFTGMDTGEVDRNGMASMIAKSHEIRVSFAEDVDLKHNPHDAIAGASNAIAGAKKCAAMAQTLAKEFDTQKVRQLAQQTKQDVERIDSAVEHLKTIDLPEPMTLDQIIENFFYSDGYSKLDGEQALDAEKHNNLRLE